MPSATSSEMAPVGITWIGGRTSSPRRITDPLPNDFSICVSALAKAFSRSSPAMGATPRFVYVDVVGVFVDVVGDVRTGLRQFPVPRPTCGRRPSIHNLGEQTFECDGDTPLPARALRSPVRGRDLELGADRPPDDLRVLAV